MKVSHLIGQMIKICYLYDTINMVICPSFTIFAINTDSSIFNESFFNKAKWIILTLTAQSVQHKVCQSNHEKYRVCQKTHIRLDDAQTHKGARPLQMSTKNKIALLAFNHHKEYDYTLCNRWEIELSWFLNNLLLCSFHKTQTQKKPYRL